MMARLGSVLQLRLPVLDARCGESDGDSNMLAGMFSELIWLRQELAMNLKGPRGDLPIPCRILYLGASRDLLIGGGQCQKLGVYCTTNV